MANEILGLFECEACGSRADTHQARRGAGRNLYTNCPVCKSDQRTGVAVQSRLWNGTVWRAVDNAGWPLDSGGKRVKSPSCLDDLPPEPIGSVSVVEQQKEPSKSGGSDGSVVQPKREPIATDTAENGESSGWVGAMLIAALVGGVSLVFAGVRGND